MYIIISKIELSETPGELKFKEHAFTTDVSLQEEINDLYDNTLGTFIEDNRVALEMKTIDISTFFNDNNVELVYEARTEVYNSEDLKGVEVTNINQL